MVTLDDGSIPTVGAALLALGLAIAHSMKLTRRNLVLVLVALTLAVVVILTQNQSQTPSLPGATLQETTPIFEFTEADIQRLGIETPTRSFAFERDAVGIWQMTAPEQTIANQGAVAFLANLLATGTRDRPLSVPASSAITYGLDQPFATIDVALNTDETHQLVLGTFNFNRSSLYALIDPTPDLGETLEVSIVPADFETAINRPLEDWKEPENPPGSPDPEAAPDASAEPPAE